MRKVITLLAALGLAARSSAQTPNANQAAVDTLTKDVATVVLANQPGDKAAEIVNQLATCGACDAVAIIRSVGGWDAVGVKMEELSRLKNTARFQAMSPGDANAAIRQELARFYDRYKRDKNYGIPLAPEVQTQMVAKIDQILPPSAAPQQAQSVNSEPASRRTEETVTPAEDGNLDGNAIRMSQLERAVKEERANRIWMMIMSAIAGLLVGAGVVYFMLYRSLRGEVGRLTDANAKLSQEVDKARRPKVANEPRQSLTETRRNSDAYDPPQPEARPVSESTNSKPLTAETPATQPVMSSVTPAPTTLNQDKPAAEPASAPIPLLTPVPTLSAARSEVFYFPPPDPNGQFDNAHRTDVLLPESAYRFSTKAETPDVATFRFEAEPGRVARFLTYRNYMVEPACDSENSFSSTYTRVVNRRDGEATLENGTWRVKTKALIRYE